MKYQNKNKGEIGNENVFMDPKDIFKPRNAVPRSPPTINNEINNTEENKNGKGENLNKRPRQETSPGTEINIKRICDRYDSHSKKEKESKLESVETEEELKELKELVSTEKIILEIFNALDRVSEIVNRRGESDIFLSKDDEKDFRTSNNSIHKCLTVLVHKLGSVEKENTVLKYTLEQIKNNQENQVKTTYAQKTYAEIVHAPKVIKAKESETLDKEAWKTPPRVKKHETFITIANVSDAKETVQQLKKEINSKDVGGGLKKVRHLKNGAVIVESYDNKQQEKLNAILKNKPHIKSKEAETLNPMFLITGIEKGYSDEEFIEEVIRLNGEIEEELGYEVKDKIKIIAKKQCRNPNKENWILQASPNVAKWF